MNSMSETVTEKKELQNVQDRLMKMLDSVCLDPNATPKDRPAPRKKNNSQDSAGSAKSANGSRVKICPNCKSDEPWDGSSWCPSCGYYPSLKRKVFSVDLAESEVEEEEEDLDLTTMATMVPTWIYWLSGGLVFLLVESLAIRCLVPRLSQRSPIAIVQILIGLNVLGIAHIRAYFIAAHEDENLNIISILWRPFDIWKTAISQMPRVCKTVYAGTWGLAAVLFAIAFIGVDYLSVMSTAVSERRKPANPMKTVLSVASKMASAAPAPQGGSPGNIEDAIENFAGDDLFDTILDAGNIENPEEDLLEDAAEGYEGTSDTSSTTGKKKNEVKVEREIVWSSLSAEGSKEFDNEFLVIGYMTNASGQLRSLLLAETLKESGAVRYAGKYSINTRDKKFIDKLQLQLEKYRSRYPAMKTPYIAKWTAPYVLVKIVHNGVSPDGRIDEGQILYYQNKPPR